MNYRELGRSGINVSEIGLGCWTIGGLSHSNGHSSGWSSVDPQDVKQAIKVGIDAGINHFDNADVYGNGEAERLLASCIEQVGVDGDTLVIASKVGHYKGEFPHAYDARNIRAQCERSLSNLKRDYLDIYYLHHGDFGPNYEYLDDAASTMEALRTEGKIRTIGQSAYKSSQFEKIVPILQPSVIQAWAHMMDTKFIEPKGIVGQLLQKTDMSLVAFSPLNQGLLLDKYDPDNPPSFPSGDHREHTPKFSKESLGQLKPKLAAIKERFGSTNAQLASVALRYTLNFPHVASVIPGFRNPAQVSCNLEAVDRSLSDEDMQAITAIFSR